MDRSHHIFLFSFLFYPGEKKSLFSHLDFSPWKKIGNDYKGKEAQRKILCATGNPYKAQSHFIFFEAEYVSPWTRWVVVGVKYTFFLIPFNFFFFTPFSSSYTWRWRQQQNNKGFFKGREWYFGCILFSCPLRHSHHTQNSLKTRRKYI